MGSKYNLSFYINYSSYSFWKKVPWGLLEWAWLSHSIIIREWEIRENSLTISLEKPWILDIINVNFSLYFTSCVDSFNSFEWNKSEPSGSYSVNQVSSDLIKKKK